MSCRSPHDCPTMTFAWGAIKWFITPGHDRAAMTFGEVILLPGKGHARHNHPTSEEILYVLSGEGEQMVDDGAPFAIKPGDSIYVPLGAYHSTLNTGWEPLRLLAMYNPAGAEDALTGLPDYRELPPGTPVSWERTPAL